MGLVNVGRTGVSYYAEATLVRKGRDNAPDNHAPPVTDAAKAPRIELLYLPPYSPNLNLIERLCRFLKRKTARNRYHAIFAEFRATVQKVLNNLPAHRAELASLLTERFHLFTTP